MGKLFGGQIAKQLDAAFKQVSSQMGGSEAVTFTSVTPGTRTGGNLAGGTNPTSTAYPVRGFRAQRKNFYVAASNTWNLFDVIAVFGASLPSGIEPKPGDLLTLDGVVRKIYQVDVDPDSAVYSCAVN